MDIDTLFKGMQEAQIFGRGNYLQPGDYVVELKDVFVKPRREGGNLFIAEFKILESTSSIEHCKAGKTASWAPKLEWPNTFGNIKTLMFAAAGLEPKHAANDPELNAQATLMAKAACGSATALKELGEQPGFLVGVRVRLTCETITTRGKKEPFTLYNWAPYEAS